MMKKTIFALFAVSVLTIGSAFAQISIGVKGAFNMANYYGKDVKDVNLIPAGNAGIYLDYQIADGFFIRPELNYAMKGSKSKTYTIPATIITPAVEVKGATSRAHYLEIPVTFLYKGNLGGGNILLGAGPYMGVALASKIGEVKQEIGNGDFQLKRMDFGGKFYAGYELPMGLGFGLETNLGLTELSKNAKTKNIGFGVFLSYRIM